MRELGVGIRINRRTGVTFHGIEDANEAIRRGAKVISLEPGNVIMEKTGEGEGSVRLVFGGCDIKLILADDRSGS